MKVWALRDGKSYTVGILRLGIVRKIVPREGMPEWLTVVATALQAQAK